jgi:peptidoglycan/LPS O-acetylase OafA/YrhL
MANSSYSVYLIHGFFISFGAFLFGHSRFLEDSPPLRVLALIAITVAGAYTAGGLLYRWLEKPCIELGKRMLVNSRG